MITITYRHLIAGVLTDATAILLSNLAGTIGVQRNDTSAAVVADGTAMVKVAGATGLYRYTFGEPAADLEYTAFIEINNATVITRDTMIVTPTASAFDMVKLLYDALRDNPAGIISISVDGTMASYSRMQAIDELKYWQREAQLELGSRPRVANILLDRGYDSY